MKIVWTAEALADLENIFVSYLENVDIDTALAVQGRIIAQIESLCEFPERTRKSDRIPGTREAVMPKLPFIAFVRVMANNVQILNIVQTSWKFP